MNAPEKIPVRLNSIRDVLEQLVRDGELPQDRLHQATMAARRQQLPLDTALQDLGLLSPRRLAEAIAQASGVPLYRPFEDVPDPALARRGSRADATRDACVPLSDDGGTLTVAVVDVFDPVLEDRLRSAHPGRRIDKRVASRPEIHDLIHAAWRSEPDYDGLEAQLEGAAGTLAHDPAQAMTRPPVVRLCDAILEHAVAWGASDVHLEPGEHLFSLRLRVDGELRHVHGFRMAHWQALLHRLKILAELDIGKHLSAQNGQFSQRVQGRRVNFRAAVLPGMHGEIMVLRVLDQRRGGFRLGDLSLAGSASQALQRAMKKPDGLVLVTGPIASGKTTTAAAMLGELGRAGRCIVTLEDPVEIVMAHARQIPVLAERGLGFGALMREVLRQDADVVFLGEVREADAAALTVSTAMIGKRVLATLHASDAVAAILRMLALGVERGALAETLTAVSNQRLLPRLCPHCRVREPAAPAVWRAPGCPACRGTGVRGRVPVMEVLTIDAPIRDAIASGDFRALRACASQALAQATLAGDALGRIEAGDVDRAAASRVIHLGD